jgi:hypothetical protein
MKKIKFICLILPILCIAFTLASCTDKSWSLKTDDSSLSLGSFILLQLDSYYTAGQKVSEANPNAKDVLKEQVEEQPAVDWIRNDAINAGKKLLAVRKLFAEMGLSLTDEEVGKASKDSHKRWVSQGKTYEGYGVSEDSFRETKWMIPAKRDKLFKAIYGKDGTNPVSDEVLKTYYEENYINYQFFTKSLTKPPTDGTQTPQPLTDEETAAAKAKFEEYATKVNNGENIEQIVAQFKENESMTEKEDPLMCTAEKTDQLTLPEAANNKLKELETGKAAVVEVETDKTIYLVKKLDIKLKSPEMLADETERYEVLKEQAKQNFDERINERADQMAFNVNNRAMNQYPPSIYQKKKK